MVHFLNAFWHGKETFLKSSSSNEIFPLYYYMAIVHLPYSKYKDVKICCYSCRYKIRIFHSCRTRVACVVLVLRSCRSCRTRVALVWHSCFKLDYIFHFHKVENVHEVECTRGQQVCSVLLLYNLKHLLIASFRKIKWFSRIIEKTR